jgi:DNA-binding transcriptional ArsR family regulator
MPSQNALRNDETRLDSIFHALADPTRRAILRDISSGEKSVSEVARPYRLTLAAVSKHLNVLQSAELIARERRGSFQIVRLQPDSLSEADRWLAYYSQFWNKQLDSMAKFLDGGKDE